MQFKVIKRGEAAEKGLSFFYTGKVCKWGHKSPRYTNKGAREDCNPNARAGLCYECVNLMDESGRIGKTFEELMKDWDNTSEYENAVYLPIMSGTTRIGYKVVGKALIDTCWWVSASKWLWVTDKNNYVMTSLSKNNMKRNGNPTPKVKRLCIRLHRFVMGVSNDVPLMVDHVSGDKLDNRMVNLRLASREDNSHNSKRFKNNPSGFKGVGFLEYCPENPYRVRLFREGRRVLNETYPTPEEAAKRYDEFLRDNYPSPYNTYNFPLPTENGCVR